MSRLVKFTNNSGLHRARNDALKLVCSNNIIGSNFGRVHIMSSNKIAFIVRRANGHEIWVVAELFKEANQF